MINIIIDLKLTRILKEEDIGEGQYIGVYNGQCQFGYFTRETTYNRSLNFVVPNSIFPQGVPFASLEAVYVTNLKS